MSAAPATPVTRPPRLERDGPMPGSLAGAQVLTRLALRRDRIMLPVWIYALTAIAASGGYGVKAIYKTAQSRASLAASVHPTPALGFLVRPATRRLARRHHRVALPGVRGARRRR